MHRFLGSQAGAGPPGVAGPPQPCHESIYLPLAYTARAACLPRLPWLQHWMACAHLSPSRKCEDLAGDTPSCSPASSTGHSLSKDL